LIQAYALVNLRHMARGQCKLYMAYSCFVHLVKDAEISIVAFLTNPPPFLLNPIIMKQEFKNQFSYAGVMDRIKNEHKELVRNFPLSLKKMSYLQIFTSMNFVKILAHTLRLKRLYTILFSGNLQKRKRCKA